MSEPIQAISQNNYILQAPPPTATMFTTELEYDGDKISGYAGSAFKAGTDLEFGYDSADNISAINNSAITDVSLNNIVQTNSGAWGGSALPISAGPGLIFDVDNGILAANAEYNETVLLNSDSTTKLDTFTLSEPLSSFKYAKLLFKVDTNTPITQVTLPMVGDNVKNLYLCFTTHYAGWKNIVWEFQYSGTDSQTFNRVSGSYFGRSNTNALTGGDWNTGFAFDKIIGISRK